MSIEAQFALRRNAFSLEVRTTLASEGVTALFGPSGAGKTTVLRCMAGLERAPDGVFRVAGETWQEESSGVFVPPHQRAIGVVFQNVGLFPHLSVEGNLHYGRKRAQRASRSQGSPLNPDDVIDILEIRPLLRRFPSHLSGGEAHRVAIARSLLTQPRLLLLDEPLTGLDAASKSAVMAYLERLFEELAIPVVYVSHSLDEVARLADDMRILEEGRIAASGAPTDLLVRLDLPTARSDAAGSVIEAVVDRHEPAYRLTHLVFDDGELVIPYQDREPGTPVRVRIQARDVSIALHPPTATSILNVLPARVTKLADDAAGQVLVQLSMGAAALLARITRKSADELDLQPGQSVYAQVKSVGLLR